MAAKERMEPLGVDIPAALYRKLRARRDTTGQTIKRIVADALAAHLDKPFYVDGSEKGEAAR